MNNLSKKKIINNFKRQVGLELFRQRQRTNLSLSELSQATNIEMHQLDDMEIGRHLKLSTLLKLAVFYDKNIKLFYE